jgi:hypothetical protein
MKYSLRSLMIAALVGPPLLAGLYYDAPYTLAWVIIPAATVLYIRYLAKRYPRAFR